MSEKLRDALIVQAKQFEAEAKVIQAEVNRLRRLAKEARALAGKLDRDESEKPVSSMLDKKVKDGYRSKEQLC